MYPDKVQDFSDAFERVVAARITPEQQIPEIDIDAEISLDDIDPEVLQYHSPDGALRPRQYETHIPISQTPG
jgi:hypothetical protein